MARVAARRWVCGVEPLREGSALFLVRQAENQILSIVSISMDDVTKRIIAEVRPYTVVPDEGLAKTIELTLDAIDKGIPGDLVECGVWRGGSSFAMLLAQRYAYGEIRRPVHMFDSFAGMSPPVPEDGEHGRWWYARAQSGQPDPDKQNYVTASDDEVAANAVALGLAPHVHLHKGWYSKELFGQPPGEISVLRVDCDWYEPCKIVLNELVPKVSVGGAIILDDYYTWEGCILATHEYLTQNKLPWMIRTISNHCGSWLLKAPETW